MGQPFVLTKMEEQTLMHPDRHAETHARIPAVAEIFIKCFIQQSEVLSMKAWPSPESEPVVA